MVLGVDKQCGLWYNTTMIKKETTMKCGICGKPMRGTEKYAPATVYHGKCLMKATESLRKEMKNVKA
jgi:ribosomal protein L34E